MPNDQVPERALYPGPRIVGNVTTPGSRVILGRRATGRLQTKLDHLVSTVDRARMVANDPVELVRAYPDPHDQEVAGLLVGMLAYGRVVSIRAKAQQALEALGPSPADAVDRGRLRRLDGFVYRFQKGTDVPRFLRAIGRVRRAYGSLGQAFAVCADAQPTGPYVEASDRFIDLMVRNVRGPMTYGLRYLLPQSRGQGASKRLCLYLRWMIRPDDGVDLGTWQPHGVDPARLVIPLDTHIGRIGRYLGLTTRASNDLKTALDITAALRALAPEDPLRYDMALCHLGISGACPQRPDPEICRGCDLNGICRLGQRLKGA